MPVYEIKAVDHSKAVVLIATTDTASAALMKFLDALPSYRRVWVSDEAGADVSQEELVVRAAQEESQTG